MERWDFDCQKCGNNIGDAYYVEPEWYQCKKDRDAGGDFESHYPEGRGRGRVGYCFDVDCAKELNFRCPVCGSELVKVIASEHPGGKWGVRGVSEPGELKAW